MQKITDRTYHAAIYLRLSQEDGDITASGKNESNSISTQRDLIHGYLQKQPDILFETEFCDDGYTGTNFDRPGFNEMMTAVREKRVDCIIVKDLSRFGRDYIESGKYIQKVFPMLGIRFIAINDGYDSADTGNQSNDFVLPFKNLINDSYCRDISIKSRTNLEVKRRNGEFVSNFAVYGYMRSPDDKHKLVVDEEAAATVRNIFNWKQNGWNAQQIANHLNKVHIPSPMEYKKKCGQNFRTSFKTKPTAQWSAVAVLRILKNAVYTGVLEQGKTTTPNYKVKTRIVKDESMWARVENAHEAIISLAQFELVQTILGMDTCRAENNKEIYPFSGMIYCADCHSPMVHRAATSNGKKYHYYVCSGNKHDKNSCTTHNIKCDLVEKVVLATVQAHISMAIDIDNAMNQVDALDWEQREVRKINTRIAAIELDVEKFNHIKMELYEDLKGGLITKDEYYSFKEEYGGRIEDMKLQISNLISQRNAIQGGMTSAQGWFSQFRKYENIGKLTRNTIVSLIERVEINDNKDIHVKFRHADQFDTALEYLDMQKKPQVKLISMKEVG
ncbi:MAG: recombinase family protein [Oscillospiraceae bacterium]|nr:recombinase family protein [Oscillospiraceae bacterium]